MKSIFFAFVLMTSALANATWCRGEVKINQWNWVNKQKSWKQGSKIQITHFALIVEHEDLNGSLSATASWFVYDVLVS